MTGVPNGNVGALPTAVSNCRWKQIRTSAALSLRGGQNDTRPSILRANGGVLARGEPPSSVPTHQHIHRHLGKHRRVVHRDRLAVSVHRDPSHVGDRHLRCRRHHIHGLISRRWSRHRHPSLEHPAVNRVQVGVADHGRAVRTASRASCSHSGSPSTVCRCVDIAATLEPQSPLRSRRFAVLRRGGNE